MSTVAEILALPDSDKVGPVELASAVERGLPQRSAVQLNERLSRLGMKQAYRVMGVSRKILTKEKSEQLYDLARVLSAAETLFDDEEKVARFMNMKNPALGMKSPFEMARSSSAGADAVLGLIGQVRAGVAA